MKTLNHVDRKSLARGLFLSSCVFYKPHNSRHLLANQTDTTDNYLYAPTMSEYTSDERNADTLVIEPPFQNLQNYPAI